MARPRANPTRIQKSGRGHSYYLDGEHVPGVTTILGDGLPKPALVGWASKIPADVVANALTVEIIDGKPRVIADDLIAELRAWQTTRSGRDVIPWNDHQPLPRGAVADALATLRFRDRDAAANRGTEVHRLGELLAQGETVEVPDELAGHVNSYVRFLDEWRPYDAILEGVIVNRTWRYMGKFDILAWFDRLPRWLTDKIDHGPPYRGLLDIKTSRSGIFPDTGLQLEGYRNGEALLIGADEHPMPDVDFVAAIHVRADGYDVIAFDIERTQRPTTFEIFLYCMQVGRWLDWKEGAAASIRSPQLPAPHHPETPS